jgi:hypothetical protein
MLQSFKNWFNRLKNLEKTFFIAIPWFLWQFFVNGDGRDFFSKNPDYVEIWGNASSKFGTATIIFLILIRYFTKLQTTYKHLIFIAIFTYLFYLPDMLTGSDQYDQVNYFFAILGPFINIFVVFLHNLIISKIFGFDILYLNQDLENQAV